MDSDRKSTVSSFYGRKNSLDALNSDFPSPNFDAPTRTRDDASSFFNPEKPRSSAELLNPGRTSTAGYNRGSFFHTGREEPLKGGRDEEDLPTTPGHPAGWDVYADFNNAGPRYSTAFGAQQSEGYQQLPPLSSPKVEETASTTTGGPVELVTVPGLGPEWQRSELRDMTKAGKREKQSDSRREHWIAWKRGERGMCGKYFTRKVLVFTLFGICAVVAIALAFTIPRVPKFSLSASAPITAATGAWSSAVPTIFSRAPTNFSFPAFASLQVDTQGNYLPITFKHLRAQVFDLQTNRLVATGDLEHKTLPAKSFPQLQLPLNFTYIATNDSDITWANWYNSCRNKGNYADGIRPGLKFRLVLSMSINGLIGDRGASTQIPDANCPLELPLNSA